uniref:Secreted protein n=1 Tax=Knipowitschia caucasica TaxID=637954 RepID=A0AAV2L6L4_KNICA
MAMRKVEVICLGLQLAKSLRLRLKLSLNIWPLAGVLAAHVAPEPPHAVPVVHVGPEKVPRRIQALQSYGNLKLTQTAVTYPPIPPEQPAEQRRCQRECCKYRCEEKSCKG